MCKNCFLKKQKNEEHKIQSSDYLGLGGEGVGWAGSPLADLIFSDVLVHGLDVRFKGFHFWIN